MKIKKSAIVILVIVALMSTMIIGCGNNDTDANGENGTEVNDANENRITPTFSISTTAKREMLMYIITEYHEMDFLTPYAEFHGLEPDHDFFTSPYEWGVLVWSEVPLNNFQVIAIGHDNDIPYVAHVLYEMDVLPAQLPLLLNRFVTVGGIFPWEGISFEDLDGERRYFGIADDRRGEPGDPPYYFLEFVPGNSWDFIHTPNTPFVITHEGEEFWVSQIQVRPRN